MVCWEKSKCLIDSLFWKGGSRRGPPQRYVETFAIKYCYGDWPLHPSLYTPMGNFLWFFHPGRALILLRSCYISFSLIRIINYMSFFSLATLKLLVNFETQLNNIVLWLRFLLFLSSSQFSIYVSLLWNIIESLLWFITWIFTMSHLISSINTPKGKMLINTGNTSAYPHLILRNALWGRWDCHYLVHFVEENIPGKLRKSMSESSFYWFSTRYRQIPQLDTMKQYHRYNEPIP